MKQICKNCQYYREWEWCSNFVSYFFRYSAPVDVFVDSENTCAEFVQFGKKAPWWMRLFNKITRGSKR